MLHNIDEVLQIDNFTKYILKEKGMSKELVLKVVLEKLKGKLGYLWTVINNAEFSEELDNLRNESVKGDIEMFLT